MVNNLSISESQQEAIEEQFFWPAVRRAVEGGDELADQAIVPEEAGRPDLAGYPRHRGPTC